MDATIVSQALAMLQAIEMELPENGDIKEKYVMLYHDTLADLEQQLKTDLGRYRVDPSELKRRRASGDSGLPRFGRMLTEDSGPLYSEDRYCERARFLMAIRGAILYVQTLFHREPRKPGF